MKFTVYISFLRFLLPFFISQNAIGQVKITDFGAIGDGTTLNSAAIQRAIDACAGKKNRRVIVPKGTFLTGSIILKSGVTLEITEGGILLGSAKRDDYLKNDWYALILAKGQKHIRIVGKGTIDGQGTALANDVERMRRAGLIKNVKPYNRPDENHRPQIIEMTDCQYVRVEGITIKNAACWVQTYHNCADLTFRHLRVESLAYWNNDGIDLVDCRHVRLTDCFFNTADDGICLKSQDVNRLCEDIYVARCTVRSSASAFKLGTASYGGFRDIRVKNLHVLILIGLQLRSKMLTVDFREHQHQKGGRKKYGQRAFYSLGSTPFDSTGGASTPHLYKKSDS
ncbi:MAG: hypothetical protein HC817_15155 [Saprospiraceae bacterium]|nr:hypothetical protein [Saprospiraceae bacterium]